MLVRINQNLLYVFSPDGDPRAGKVVMNINLAKKGSAQLFTNGLVNTSLVPADALDNAGTYETVWEK